MKVCFDMAKRDAIIRQWRDAAEQARDPRTKQHLTRLADQLAENPSQTDSDYQTTTLRLRADDGNAERRTRIHNGGYRHGIERDDGSR